MPEHAVWLAVIWALEGQVWVIFHKHEVVQITSSAVQKHAEQLTVILELVVQGWVIFQNHEVMLATHWIQAPLTLQR